MLGNIVCNISPLLLCNLYQVAGDKHSLAVSAEIKMGFEVPSSQDKT